VIRLLSDLSSVLADAVERRGRRSNVVDDVVDVCIKMYYGIWWCADLFISESDSTATFISDCCLLLSVKLNTESDKKVVVQFSV